MGDWGMINVPIYTLAKYNGMGDAPTALHRAGAGRILGSAEELGERRAPPTQA